MAISEQKISKALNKVTNSAKEFSGLLNDLADVLDADFEKVVRLTVLKLYRNIRLRSPVVTGAYRASHDIAIGAEPSESEGIKGLQTDEELNALETQHPNLKWKIGDGTIWIFNNQPYASVLEAGSSTQAPQGIYAVALAEFENALRKEIKQARTLQ